MKLYGRAKVYLNSFLTYMEVSGQLQDLVALPPEEKAFSTADI